MCIRSLFFKLSVLGLVLWSWTFLELSRERGPHESFLWESVRIRTIVVKITEITESWCREYLQPPAAKPLWFPLPWWRRLGPDDVDVTGFCHTWPFLISKRSSHTLLDEIKNVSWKRLIKLIYFGLVSCQWCFAEAHMFTARGRILGKVWSKKPIKTRGLKLFNKQDYQAVKIARSPVLGH